MRELLQGIAILPQTDNLLPIRVLAGDMAHGFCLTRSGASPAVEVAALHDGSSHGRCEAEAVARMLSGAPAMLDLLATALLRWGEDVAEDRAIDGGDAVAWLSGFTTDICRVLEQVVGQPPPDAPPLHG